MGVLTSSNNRGVVVRNGVVVTSDPDGCGCCCVCPWDVDTEGPQKIAIKGYADGDIKADCASCMHEDDSASDNTNTWDGQFCRADTCRFTAAACDDVGTEINIDTNYEMATAATEVFYDFTNEVWRMKVYCDNSDGTTNSLLWEGTACRAIDVYNQIDGCSPGPSKQEIVEVA